MPPKDSDAFDRYLKRCQDRYMAGFPAGYNPMQAAADFYGQTLGPDYQNKGPDTTGMTNLNDILQAWIDHLNGVVPEVPAPHKRH